MKVKESGFSKFFRIGRERGWDPISWKWTVHGLVGPAGPHPTVKEIGGIDPEIRLDWSGESMGPLALRKLIAESQQYKVDPAKHIVTTCGTRGANFLAAMSIV